MFVVTDLKKTDTREILLRRQMTFDDQISLGQHIKVFPSNKSMTPKLVINTGVWPYRLEVDNGEEFFLYKTLC